MRTQNIAITALLVVSFGLLPKTAHALRTEATGTYTDSISGLGGTWYGEFDAVGARIEGWVTLEGVERTGSIDVDGSIDVEAKLVSFAFSNASPRQGYFSGSFVQNRLAGDFVLDSGRRTGTWTGRWRPGRGLSAPHVVPQETQPPAIEEEDPLDVESPVDPNDPCTLIRRRSVRRLMSGAALEHLQRRCTGDLSASNSAPRPTWASRVVDWSLTQLRRVPYFSDVYAQAPPANQRVNNPSGDTYPPPAISQREVSIAVSGNSKYYVVAAFNDTGSFNLTGYATSSDGGQTWIDRGAPPDPAGGFGGVDPVLGSDSNGYFYLGRIVSFGYLSIGVSKSTNKGVTFSAPIDVQNSSPLVGASDKPDLAVDRVNGNIYVCWTQFQNSPSRQPIVFARSTNGGSSFQDRRAVSDDTPTHSQPIGCSIAVAPSPDPANKNAGIVHVGWWQSWTQQIEMITSTDGGLSFAAAPCCDPGTRFPATCGSTPQCKLVGAAHYPPVDPDPACGGWTTLNGHWANEPFAYLATEKAPVPSVYAVWDDWNNTANSSEILFSVSTDAGGTWQGDPQVPGSLPVRLNDSTTNDQFQPRIAVTLLDTQPPPWSAVRVIWYDRRRDPANRGFDVYYTSSVDFGHTWQANSRMTDTANFDPLPTLLPNFDCYANNCRFGEYIGFSDYPTNKGLFIAAWGDTRPPSVGPGVGGTCPNGRPYPGTSPDPNIRSAAGC